MALTEDSFKTETFIEVLDRYYDILCDFEVYWLTKSGTPNTCLDICCKCYYYLITQDIYNGSNVIKEWISDLVSKYFDITHSFYYLILHRIVVLF